jgi:hypothetical protein
MRRMDTVTRERRWMRASLAVAAILSAGCDPSSFDALTDGADARTGTEAEQAGDAAPGRANAPKESGRDGGPLDPSVSNGASWWAGPNVGPARSGDAAAAEPPLSLGDAATGEMLLDGGMGCGDTLRDPANCGSCGYDCAAPSAVVSCINGTCNRTCASGYDDCDNDRVHGSEGNGCESRVVDDVDNCGACRKRCVPPEYGIATCSAQVCSGHTMMATDFTASPLHGNTTGGGPFSTPCLDGEVMIGISGLGDANIVYATRVHCARLELKQANGITSVGTRATWMTDLVGGDNLIPVPSFSLLCPPNTIVTKVSGSTDYYDSVVTVPNIKRISLTCSAVKVDANFALSLTVDATIQIGRDAAAPIEVFEEPCRQPGAAMGLSGRSGAYLDALAVHCGKLMMRKAPAGVVTSPAGTKRNDVATK